MIKEVLTYINHHLDGDISLEKLSAISGYSPFHLHRKFKLEVGEPIGHFIIQQRIETAAFLLALTSLPISRIQSLVGYQTASSFYKAFRKVMKLSPSEFRASNRYASALTQINSNEYLSLNYEILSLPPRNAIVFPSVGNYFEKEIYTVWDDVKAYLHINQLNENQFDYIAILHTCQNITPDLPGRYDAVIVPRHDQSLASNKFFQTQVPGGDFIRYRFCASADQFQRLSLVIGSHMESQGIRHGSGISYLEFSSLPDSKDPNNLLTDWYLPIQK